jgi:15-cis-phytoene synthase
MTAEALAEAYVHCGQIARVNERDLWLAALFAPAPLRPHLHALAAFVHETGGVAARVREPLAGEMRLAWWREALAGARAAEAAGAPIAAAVIDTMAKFSLPISAFDGLLQALTFDVYDDAMDSLEGLEAYGIATAGAAIALRARVLAEGRETGAQAATDAAGAGLALVRAVLDFAQGRRHPLLTPRALLERHGVSYSQARAGSGGEGLRAALVKLADAAAARLDEAESRLSALPAALAPAFAPLAMARLDLKRWRRTPAAAFAAAAPWRRQFALWRWARRR